MIRLVPIPHRPHLRFSLLCLFLFSGPVFSQTDQPTYVDPTAAASGMTTGLENGATAETINMMQIRAAAQEAERAAAAAAMARSAEEAIEEQNLNSALARARETRRLKREAAERLKWQQATAQNAYQPVSQGEMASWKDEDGNVKVGSGLPPEFVMAVQDQEAAEAATRAEEEGEERRFAPFKAGQKIVERAGRALGAEEGPRDPGLRGPQPLPPPEEEERRGFRIPKLKAPDLGNLPFPKFGKRDDVSTGVPQFADTAPTTASAAQSVATTGATTSAVAAEAAANPVPTNDAARSIGARSGNALLGENSFSAADPPSSAEERSGLFSRARNSSGLFGFGRKKSDTLTAAPSRSSNSIDTGLFPAGPVTATTEGSSVPRDSTPVVPVSIEPASTSPVSSAPAAPASSPNQVVSTLSAEEPERRFSIPKPNLQIPKPSIGRAEPGAPSGESAVNRNGNRFYVVDARSQLMQYGDSTSESTISAVAPGTVVMMTKPGTDWATVQLEDGSTGIIQTKNLRAASNSEIPAN